MQKGFTLLYAVLISSIALTIGLSAFSLVYGELALSGNARDSIIALYAADAGVECGIYWDYNFDPANPSEAAFNNDGTQNSIFCFGDAFGRLVGGGSPPEADFSSQFTYSLPNGPEVTVTVTKDQSFNSDGCGVADGCADDDTTVIIARGRNKGGTGPRIAERALRDIHRNPF